MRLSTLGEKVFVQGSLYPLSEAIRKKHEVTEVHWRLIDFADYNVGMNWDIIENVETLNIEHHFQEELDFGFLDRVSRIKIVVDL